MVLAGSSLETWDLNNVVRKLFWNFDDGSACWMKVLTVDFWTIVVFADKA